MAFTLFDHTWTSRRAKRDQFEQVGVFADWWVVFESRTDDRLDCSHDCTATGVEVHIYCSIRMIDLLNTCICVWAFDTVCLVS